MTTEREHARATATSDRVADHDDLAVGHVNRSAQLDAPTQPVVSALIQRKASRDDNGVAAGADAAVATASGSSGHSLPEPILRKFEGSLGADLSSVRIHTGSDSASAAHEVGARAYTMGQDIHFGAGQYDPSSAGGEHLLAHEVAHTVQQQGGSPMRQHKLEVSAPHDGAEHEADRAADAMVQGASFSVTSGGGFQRKVFRGPPNGGVSGPSYAAKGPEGSVIDDRRKGTMTVGVYTQEYDNTCADAAVKIFTSAKQIYTVADAIEKDSKGGKDKDLVELAKQVRSVAKSLEGMKKGWDTLKAKNFDFSKTKVDNDPELPKALELVKSAKDSVIQGVATNAALTSFEQKPSRETANAWADNLGKQFSAAKSVVGALPFPPGCGWMKDYFTGLLGAPAAYISAFQALVSLRYGQLDKDVGYLDGSERLYDTATGKDAWEGGGPVQKMVSQAYTAPDGLALYNWIRTHKVISGADLQRQPLAHAKALIITQLSADEATAKSRDGWVAWIQAFQA